MRYHKLLKTERVPAGVAAERHLASIEKIDGCWLWPGAMNDSIGYGVVSMGPHARPPLRLAHLWVYERLVGPIPPRYEIDHLCHNDDMSCVGGITCLHRRCVNPAHLEAVTKAENNLRRRTGERRKACAAGHERNDKNTLVRITDGKKTHVCRKCHNRRNLEWKARQRAI